MYERMLNKLEQPTAEEMAAYCGENAQRFAENGSFTVMARLTNAVCAEVYDKLDSYSQDLLDNKYPCNDGGWIHYRVTDSKRFEEIKIIIASKCKGK